MTTQIEATEARIQAISEKNKANAAANLVRDRAFAGANLATEVETILSLMQDGPAKEALQAAFDGFNSEIKAARDKHEAITGVRYSHQVSN